MASKVPLSSTEKGKNSLVIFHLISSTLNARKVSHTLKTTNRSKSTRCRGKDKTGRKQLSQNDGWIHPGSTCQRTVAGQSGQPPSCSAPAPRHFQSSPLFLPCVDLGISDKRNNVLLKARAHMHCTEVGSESQWKTYSHFHLKDQKK